MFPPLFVTLFLSKYSAPVPVPSLAHSLSAFTAGPEEQLSALTLPVNPPLPHLPLFGPLPPLPSSRGEDICGEDGEWPLPGRQGRGVREEWSPPLLLHLPSPCGEDSSGEDFTECLVEWLEWTLLGCQDQRLE